MFYRITSSRISLTNAVIFPYNIGDRGGLSAAFMCLGEDAGPSGAMAAQPTCNRQVSGFESPLGLYLQTPNTTEEGKHKRPTRWPAISPVINYTHPCFSEGWVSGLNHQTVNLALERASQVRILPPPPYQPIAKPQPNLTAHIAQTVEHALGKGEVDGSSPSVGSSSHPGPKFNYLYSRRNLDGKAEI